MKTPLIKNSPLSSSFICVHGNSGNNSSTIKLKNIGLFILGVFISFVNFAQILTTMEISSIEEIEVCQTENFAISIDKISGSYTSTDTIIVEMALPSSIHFLNAVLSGTGSVSIDNGNPENPICTISGVTGSSIGFNYTVSSSCDLISASTSVAQSNNYTIYYNGAIDHTLSSLSFNIVSPWIIFDNAGSTNMNYNLGQFNIPFERTLKYTNTSSTPYSGDFLFIDTITTDYSNSGIQFQDIELISPISGVDIFKTVTDSSIQYKLAITNLQQGESIIFKETVYLIKCPNGAIDNSVAQFSVNYGCTNGALCQTIENPTHFTTAAFDPNDKPVIKLDLLTTGYQDCWNIPQERLVKITNIGSGDASDVRMRFYVSGGPGSITEIDLNSIEFFKKPGATEIPVNHVPIDDFGNYPFYDSAYSSNQVLAAGDSIFIRYDEIINCISPSQYASYFNEGVKMHHETPHFYLEHPCNSSNAGYSTGGYPYGWRTWEHIFSLKQNFENLNGTILDNEELWYEIDNATPLILGRANNRFIFNADSSELMIRLVLDSGLGLVSDSLYMYSPQGSSTVELLPYWIEYAQGNGINTGTGDTAIAHFRIPSNFYVDFPPNVPSGLLQNRTADFLKFFNNNNKFFWSIHLHME